VLLSAAVVLWLSSADAATADAGGPAVAPVDAGVPDAGPSIPPQLLYPRPLGRKVDEARVERVLASLDTQAKVAQLLLAYPQIDRVGPVRVGGVLFVGNSLRNVEKAREKIDAARVRAAVPPFFAVDMEGGASNRLGSVRSLRGMPGARELAGLDDGQVKSWGRKVGAVMKGIGLNLNLAPVFDVAPSGHMERNQRSFSGDAGVVQAKASAYARGLLEEGVVPIGKHFPGYGDIDGDSDHAFVTCDWPKERVLAEAAVFERAEPFLGGVMLANVAYASFDERPAILSPALVALVHQHDWLAVTDDISIQVLADAIGGTKEDVLVAAFRAGNDLLLTTAPPDWNKGTDYVGVLTRLVEHDAAARAQLDAAARRVLRLKDRMGLLDGL